MAGMSNALRQTLIQSPEAQWHLRRQMNGLNLTLDASPESQRALQQLRDEVVAETYARIEADSVELEVSRMFEGA